MMLPNGLLLIIILSNFKDILCVRENWVHCIILHLSTLLSIPIHILVFRLKEIDDPIVKFHVPCS